MATVRSPAPEMEISSCSYAAACASDVNLRTHPGFQPAGCIFSPGIAPGSESKKKLRLHFQKITYGIAPGSEQ